MSESVLPMFSSRSFIVSGLTFRSLIHFEFIFVYGVRKELISITDTESQTLKRHLVLQKGSHCKEGLNQDTGINMGIPGGQTVKNPTAVQETRVQSLGKIPWRRKWQPTPVFLPGESHGHSSLVGYLPWSCKKWDTTE